MTYEKQTWGDYDPDYPLSAARMGHMEDGIKGAHTTADATQPRTKTRAVGQGEILYNIRDYGSAVAAGYVVGSGGNDTLAIQAALNAAANYGGTVLVPPGVFRAEELTVPKYTILKGVGAGSRFGAYTAGGSRASSAIVRPNGSDGTKPMVTIRTEGSGIQGLQLNGAIPGGSTYGTGTILTMSGFENELVDVRVIYCNGIGLDVQRANNVRWQDIRVDNCGSTTEAAVKIWSRDKTEIAGFTNETNTVFIYNLTIERSKNSALDVAYGATGDYWAEWVTFYGLHIESSYLDNPNSDALVRIGNVRNVEFYGAFIYGGPAVLIRHQQRVTRAYGNGGIRFYGGCLLGSDTSIVQDGAGNPVTPQPTIVAVELLAGTDFLMHGTRVMRITTRIISVAVAYGKFDYDKVHSDNGTEVTGAPTVTASSGAQNPAVGAKSDDHSGRVFFGTGAAPTAGILVVIQRYHNDGREYTMVLTPKTAATAVLGLYAAQSGDRSQFTIRAANVPAASVANNGFQVDYRFEPIGS